MSNFTKSMPQEKPSNVFWVIPAAPLVLSVLIVAAPYLINLVPGLQTSGAERLGRFLGFWLVPLFLVGILMIPILATLIFTGKQSFAEPRIKISLALAILDLVVPVILLVWIVLALRNFQMGP